MSLRECHILLAQYLADQAGLTDSRREAVLARAVRRLVRHAYRRVPYYRRLFDRHGIDPAAIRSVADLARVPVTTKQDIMALPPEEVVAEGVDPDRLPRIRTSGSTGQPLTILRTRPEQTVSAVRALYSHYEEGLRPSYQRATISSARRTPGRRRPLPKRLLHAVGLYRHRPIDCCLPREEIISRLRSIRPDHIGGYAGAIADAAAGMSNADREAIRPRTIGVSSEVLTPGMRRTIQNAFGVEPFNRYGCHELGLIAWECRAAHGMHICTGGGVFEVVRDGRPAAPGETGRLIGTSLYCFAMPFIRYDVGDLVTFGGHRCRCGARVPVLERVDGRTIQVFLLPNGGRLHAYEMVRPLLDSAPWMMQYQIAQTGPRDFTVRVVPRPDAMQPDSAKIEGILQSAVGERAGVKVTVIDRISPDPLTGKYPVFVPAPAAERAREAEGRS